ncbi:hypothetical protein [Acanthamoeba castellanii mimivirus]|nr:hypothetical protein HIRU_S16 [Hirudovirus strain Sangsue]AKI79688.1 hypothetical protein [Acanthamoeba polyphaga mimivirus]AMK62099.1 hypothetical protein [Samba virus]EJN40515.1 hypothetical protein lvs_R790 [Acanthamoeba polyphaga lentillevirus]BAV62039.1 hypothetical protein [Acanthamoeba castellanii mimivirus]
MKRNTLFVRQSCVSSSRIGTQLPLNKSKIYTSSSINITNYKQDQKLYTRHYYTNGKIFENKKVDQYLKVTEEMVFSFMNGFTDGCICGTIIILCLINT